MLPVGTTTIGFGVFSARLSVYHEPKNTATMIVTMTVAVWMVSLFQAFLRAVVSWRAFWVA
jgi:hypothetical protein